MPFSLAPPRAALCVLRSFALIAVLLSAEARAEVADIATATRGYEKSDGLLPLYRNAAGKLLLEVPNPGEPLIYVTTLTQGLGSNDVGLDRGQIGDGRVVSFERYGDKLLLVQHNTSFRADSANADERRAVAQSFADSVLWGFPIVGESGGHVLVDAGGFALQDNHGAIAQLKKTGQGSFALDASRSAVAPEFTKAFPRNTEIESLLTFKSDAPGKYVQDVAPEPQAVSLRERLSFIALPTPGYVPRVGDPRAGYFEVNYADYATPIGVPLMQHLIVRHRLRKKDPTAAVSEAVEPIVYYLDRGAPPPIREALLEGARWWAQAFEAAGYRNAFRVELLPEGADPMDIRYNVIQWVHRQTRGWSYGSVVADPRTGEILKANITLGSLRARYDWLIAEGLLSPYGDDTQTSPEMQKLVLARLRQLAAHELGHTLGLAHNYLSSAQGRASVMDYPQPLVKLRGDGSLDLSEAYATGIGEWDKVAIAYGYQDFAAGTDEPAALNAIIDQARGRGYTFLSDIDARPAGAAEPQTSLWDNGADAVAELDRMMKVRAAALARFGDNAIRRGEPMSTIEDALVPLFLYHRYQLEAAAKTMGGQYYRYALRGDGQVPLQPVPAAQQQRALQAVLATLAPKELAVPRRVLAAIPPRPHTYAPTRELFGRRTDPVFDALAPAEAATEIALDALLQPQRAARLVEQHALDAKLPGLDTVLDSIAEAIFDARGADGYEAAILRVEQRSLVEHLLALSEDAPMQQVRALAALQLDTLSQKLAKAGGDVDERAHRALLVADIRRVREHPELRKTARSAPTIPPGSPLGADEE